MNTHVLGLIESFADGELTTEQADTVRAHCAACETCGHALEESMRVRAFLRVDNAQSPLRPMWPEIRDRAVAGRRPDWRFVLGSSLAAVAGIVLAFFLGTVNPVTPRAATGDAWADLGATVAGGTGAGMSELYLNSPEGAKTP